jgi:phospholipase C
VAVDQPSTTQSATTSSATTASVAGLSSIDHIVVLMLENRSFDHMLGYLYADASNVSAAGQPFEGLTGAESNPDGSGHPVAAYRLTADDPNVYLSPGADPGEGYKATNDQLFGTESPRAGASPTNDGFVTDFASTLVWEAKDHWDIVAGTRASDIMGMFTPELLPVLSALARGFAVCDHWYASVPTLTLPNRAFVCAGTSQGHMDDKTKKFTAPSIFGLLSEHQVSWTIYGYNAEPLTRLDFPDTISAPDANFGQFPDFQAAAATGSLASYVFLEPSWESTGNSQHPNYEVALGEQFIHDVYQALRAGPAWERTLLILTYDEHGGCYDHVAPPTGATPPDGTPGEYGFDFTRFGVRVPTVLISPLIPAGTVFRVPPGTTPFDHTSILKTVEQRWGLPSLTARDKAAPDVSAVLTLATPRTDDPLAGVVVPTSSNPPPGVNTPSHLQKVQAELASELPVPEGSSTEGKLHTLLTADDYQRYIDDRVQEWKAGRSGGS